MKTSNFDYALPPELIAQNPLKKRDHARMLVLHQEKGTIQHRHVYDLPQLLTKNDVLVFNDTKVFPARLRGFIEGKSVELLLHREKEPGQWECLTKPGKRFKKGARVECGSLIGKVIEIQSDGSRIIQFNKKGAVFHQFLEEKGETPLPPYLRKSHASPEQYQTVYAKTRGSVAAPTAGLHFTPELLEQLREKGVTMEYITLHVGRGTFEPVKTENIASHIMHKETFNLTVETAQALNNAKAAGKRIISVGTTTARVLETCAKKGKLVAQRSETQLFITPGYTFQFVDRLLTNFHLPQSTLLMLISAFTGEKTLNDVYALAITKKYRFLSFGDAMLIL